MSEILDFSDAKVSEGNNNKYLEPGVYLVKVTEVSNGKSNNKQSPFVRITVENTEGKTCTEDMYLNGGAFPITKNSITTLVMAANDLTEDLAKAKLTGMTTDNIADKLAPVLVGKTLAIHIAGKWVNPIDTEKKPFIKGIFGNYKFAVPANRINELKHDPNKHIKGEKVDNGTNTTSTNTTNSSNKAAAAW